MTTCTEVAIFNVAKDNIARVKALSLLLFDEINVDETLITSHNIFQKIDNDEQLCWLLTWRSKEAAKSTSEKWPYYPSTKALESLVGEKVYYGHFVELS